MAWSEELARLGAVHVIACHALSFVSTGLLTSSTVSATVLSSIMFRCRIADWAGSHDIDIVSPCFDKPSDGRSPTSRLSLTPRYTAPARVMYLMTSNHEVRSSFPLSAQFSDDNLQRNNPTRQSTAGPSHVPVLPRRPARLGFSQKSSCDVTARSRAV